MYTHYTHIQRESVSIFSVLRYFTFACRRGRLYATFIYSLWLFFQANIYWDLPRRLDYFIFFIPGQQDTQKHYKKKVKRLISLINEMK